MSATQGGNAQSSLGEGVSPATRLLEKRRQMYEMQEDYESKKKDCKQAELKFRDEEKNLRNQDLQIQESMIQFSVFLQENDRKKSKADEKIKNEEDLLIQKELEISRKLRQLKSLQERSKRINLKKEAIMKYEKYLEKVQLANPDEFEEINKIIDRHSLLTDENKSLNQTNKDLEDQCEDMKHRIDQYEKQKRQEILQLNNEISKNNKVLETILEGQKELRSQSEDVKFQKLSKMSELAQILMAIDNIEQKCFNRTYEKKYDNAKTSKAILRHYIPDHLKPKKVTFDDPNHEERWFEDKHVYAKRQLEMIENYAQDFKAIYNNLKEQPEIKTMLKNTTII